MRLLIGAFDERFAYPTLQSVLSAKFQHQDLIWLLGSIAGEVRATTKNDLHELFSSLRVNVSIEEFPDDPLFTERHALSKTTFCKFRLTDSRSDAMLWLDSDVLAIAPFESLLDVVFQKNPTRQLVVCKYRGHGFNAGVMGFTASAREPWREVLANQPAIRKNSEQNVFNEIYKGKYVEVSREFNFIWQWLAGLHDGEIPRLIHYGGPLKPWHMPLRLAGICKQADCTWAPWLRHESVVLGLLPSDLRRRALKMRRASRMRPHLSPAYFWFIFLQVLGVLPIFITEALGRIISPLRNLIPGVLHPIHGTKIDVR